MALLNKHNFKKIQKKHKVVECKEYDLEVKIVALSLKDQLEIESFMKDDIDSFIKEMLCRCCVDENDTPIFNKDEVDQLPADLVSKVFNECLKLNNLGPKALDDLAKN